MAEYDQAYWLAAMAWLYADLESKGKLWQRSLEYARDRHGLKDKHQIHLVAMQVYKRYQAVIAFYHLYSGDKAKIAEAIRNDPQIIVKRSK
jgi:hypothetical protein